LKKMKRALVAILLVPLVLGSVVAVAYFIQRENAPVIIQVIIPDGYRGLAVIHFDVASGSDVPQVGETFTYIFPKGGNLSVRGDNPQYRWHRAYAKYDTGAELPVATFAPQANLNPRTIYVWSLSLNKGDAGFLVGTPNEKDAYDLSERRKIGLTF
jgi:hypothetical protein